MIRSLFILSCLLLSSHSSPATTCDQQAPCLDIKMKSLDHGETYMVCITFDSSRYGCNKQGKMSFACPNGNAYDKIRGWREGNDNKMCKTVKCGFEAQFGIKDGKGCTNTKPMLGLTNNNITDIRCEFASGYCYGGNQRDCTWTIPTPQCPLASCPSQQPSPGDACNFEGTCYWGQESCCGQTFDSFGCQCANGQTACFYTDACLGAAQHCGTTTKQPEPAFCGGIACEEGFYCVDDPNDNCDGVDCGGVCVQPGDGCDFCLRPLCPCGLCPDGENSFGCCGSCEYGKGETELECVYTGNTVCPITEACPSQQASPGDSCSFEGTCYWGEVSCCGQTFDSFACSCINGQTACFYTDACLGAAGNCDTTSGGIGAEINSKPMMNDNHDINNNDKWYDGLSNGQFLLFSVFVTCLLIIAACLICYLFKKCNVSKYQGVANQRADVEI